MAVKLKKRSMSLVAAALRLLIRIYQGAVSPFFPAHCRFWPSCSAYAAEAVQKYGALEGAWLAVRRIVRCHPWGGSGYDPVPESCGCRESSQAKTAVSERMEQST
jgi:putative membrane protein insertion efficiency factor